MRVALTLLLAVAVATSVKADVQVHAVETVDDGQGNTARTVTFSDPATGVAGVTRTVRRAVALGRRAAPGDPLPLLPRFPADRFARATLPPHVVVAGGPLPLPLPLPDGWQPRGGGDAWRPEWRRGHFQDGDEPDDDDEHEGKHHHHHHGHKKHRHDDERDWHGGGWEPRHHHDHDGHGHHHRRGPWWWPFHSPPPFGPRPRGPPPRWRPRPRGGPDDAPPPHLLGGDPITWGPGAAAGRSAEWVPLEDTAGPSPLAAALLLGLAASAAAVAGSLAAQWARRRRRARRAAAAAQFEARAADDAERAPLAKGGGGLVFAADFADAKQGGA